MNEVVKNQLNIVHLRNNKKNVREGSTYEHFASSCFLHKANVSFQSPALHNGLPDIVD